MSTKQEFLSEIKSFDLNSKQENVWRKDERLVRPHDPKLADMYIRIADTLDEIIVYVREKLERPANG